MAKRDIGRVMQELTTQVRRTGHKLVLRQALTELIKEVNKGGVKRQLQFLLKTVGVDQTKALVDRCCQEEHRLKRVSRAVGDGFNAAGDRLTRAVYDEHVGKANELIRKGPRDLVRYLASVRGTARVEKMLAKLLQQS